MTDRQYEEMCREAKDFKHRLERGKGHFARRVPLAEIVDEWEQRGWMCARAFEEGRRAHDNSENPYDKGELSYQKVMCSHHFKLGLSSKNGNNKT